MLDKSTLFYLPNSCKNCPKCGEIKSLDCFGKDKRQKDGLHRKCKDCINAWLRENRKNPLVKSKRSAYAKTAKAKETNRIGEWRREYGISPEEYNRMFEAQQGKCLGCLKHQTEFKKRLCVDHCHKTGKVRGLLCDPCNRGMGLLKDSQDILNRLVRYLEEGNK